MKHICTFIIATLLPLNTQASTAWVLWAEITSYWDGNPVTKSWNKQDIQWQLYSAHENKAACETELKNSITKLTTGKQPDDYSIMYKVSENVVNLAYFPKGREETEGVQKTQAYRLICMPETIDPRK